MSHTTFKSADTFKFWKDRLLFLSLIVFLVGSLLAFDRLYLNRISHRSDLIEARGELLSYHFTDGYRGHKNYYIHLMQDYSTYQIPAEFLNDFDVTSFKSQIKKGDPLILLIPRVPRKLPFFSDYIFVFGLASANKQYLVPETAIHDYNRSVFYWCFIFGGLALYIGRVKFLQHKRKSYSKTSS